MQFVLLTSLAILLRGMAMTRLQPSLLGWRYYVFIQYACFHVVDAVNNQVMAVQFAF